MDSMQAVDDWSFYYKQREYLHISWEAPYLIVLSYKLV